MVNTRQPSQACGPCRAKRRKCDRAKPSCSQCRRAGVTCDGYRDEGLRFPIRDQTQLVKSKFKSTSTSTSASPGSSPGSSTSSELDVQSAMLSPTAVFPFPSPTGLPLVFDDFATATFCRLFLPRDNPTASGQLFGSLGVHQQESQMLRDILGALGIVTHRSLSKDHQLTQFALKRYASALSNTQKALQTPALVRKDETVLAVVLLALYELMTCSTNQSFDSWAAHVDGASNLLALRGEDQLRTSNGRALFMHLRQRIFVLCFWRAKDAPAPIRALSDALKKYQTADEAPANALADLVFIQCAKRAAIARQTYSDPDEMLDFCYDLDARLAVWAASVPDGFRPQRFSAPSGTFVYEGEYDVYPTRFAASTWNHYCTCRLMTARRTAMLLPLSTRHTTDAGDAAAKQRTANALANRLAADICRSFRFLLGKDTAAPPPTPTAAAAAAFDLHSASAIPWLVRHVLLAGGAEGHMRTWLFALLRHLADWAGMQQALVIGAAIQSRIDTESLSPRLA